MATRQYSDNEFKNLKKWLDLNQDTKSEKIMNAELLEVISADYKTNRVMLTNSCMGSLHLALQTIGVGPGDEVIVDPIVVFAGMATMYANAVPVFADVQMDTFNICPNSIRDKISERTKAIICTHHFGSMCDMAEIMKISEEFHIPVVEDCAHCLFATQNDKYAGLFGHFGAFSFNHRKQLSAGQGGFLTINTPEFEEKSKDKGFGRVPDRLTWNYSLSGILSAVIHAQWEPAKSYVQKDHDLANLYSEAIEGCEWFVPQKIISSNWSAYHIWASKFDGEQYGIDYEQFMKLLRENGADYFLPSFMPYGAFGLDPSPAYRYPIFSQPRAFPDSELGRGCPTMCPHYKGTLNYDEGACPNAEKIVPNLFNTVLSPIEDDRIHRYADGLKKTIQYFN